MRYAAAGVKRNTLEPSNGLIGVRTGAAFASLPPGGIGADGAAGRSWIGATKASVEYAARATSPLARLARFATYRFGESVERGRGRLVTLASIYLNRPMS